MERTIAEMIFLWVQIVVECLSLAMAHMNEQSLVVSKAAAAEVCETVSKDSVSSGRTLDAGEGSEGR